MNARDRIRNAAEALGWEVNDRGPGYSVGYTFEERGTIYVTYTARNGVSRADGTFDGEDFRVVRDDRKADRVVRWMSKKTTGDAYTRL